MGSTRHVYNSSGSLKLVMSPRLIDQRPESNLKMFHLKNRLLLLTRRVRRTKYKARVDFKCCLDDILKYDWSKLEKGLSSTQLEEYLILF